MSGKHSEAGRKKYRLELGRQFSGKYGLKIFRLTEKNQYRLSGVDGLYDAVRKDIFKDVGKMTDETLGRIIGTIPEVWGRRAIALLKKTYPLEKPTIGFDGPEILQDFAACAIVGAMWDYLQ